jgi:Phage tail assembly chaperone protein, TAC
MTSPVSFPSSQSASQQFTYETPAGSLYVLHKLPAMRYLALGNALVSYFGESAIKGVISLVKAAKTTDMEEIEKMTEGELLEKITEALENLGGLGTIPMDAFQKLARLVCPFIEVRGKGIVSPHESNTNMVDTQIDLMFADHPGDILPVVARAIAFNLADFFSAARLPSILKRRTESS